MSASKTFRILAAGLCVLLVQGCASTAKIRNEAIVAPISVDKAVLTTGAYGQRSSEALFLLAFSGGGTRAAALSYGVLEALRDTTYNVNGKELRLLDEVDAITSVSGGSFTAAYYGLHGEGIFDDYEYTFLRRDVQRSLINGLLNPVNWVRMLVTGFNRTEMAIDYYERQIFRQATFSDIEARDGPVITINATDLGIGQRFSFTQDYFNLICSDLDSFSIARAVTASSAVPVAFAPVTLQNHAGCERDDNRLQQIIRKAETGNDRVRTFAEGLASYADKEARPYIHLVDGGVTDNLGIRTLYDHIEIQGGARSAVRNLGQRPKIIIVILVNAETRSARPMDQRNKTPSASEVVAAVSNTQIGRYNIESEILLRESLQRWATDLSDTDDPVETFFIQIDFESVADERQRLFYNNMATSFSLPDNEVDGLIEAGHRLLKQSPEFQRLDRRLKSYASE